MASIHTIQSDLDTIKPLLKEIKELLEKLNSQNSTSEIVEVAAAKIISEMKACSKEILEAFNKTPTNQLIIHPKIDKSHKLQQYSYPNNSVGNEELGTGKNPNSLTWPFGQ